MRDRYSESAKKAQFSMLSGLQEKLSEFSGLRRRGRGGGKDIESRLRSFPAPDAPEDLLMKLQRDARAFHGKRELVAHQSLPKIASVAAAIAVILVMATVALTCILVADITPHDAPTGLVAELTPRPRLAEEEAHDDMTVRYVECARCFHDSAAPRASTGASSWSVSRAGTL